MNRRDHLVSLVCDAPLTYALGQTLKKHSFGKAFCLDLSDGSDLACELQEWDDPCERIENIFIEMGLHVSMVRESDQVILMKIKGWIYNA